MSGGTELRVGIDLCAADEVADAIERFGDRYLQRVYTVGELASCTTDGQLVAERLAGRFAAKEATVKLLRPDDTGIDLRSIEIERQPGGWCEVHLDGEAAALAHRAGIEQVTMSLTHERGLAAAVVVANAHRPPQPTDERSTERSVRRPFGPMTEGRRTTRPDSPTDDEQPLGDPDEQ